MPWNWGEAAKSTAFGAAMGPVGRYVGSKIPLRRPYSNLEDHPSIGRGKDFTTSAKARIIEQNKARNGGIIRSDEDGSVLVSAQQSRRGVTPPHNAAAVDHIDPRNPVNPNASKGPNSFDDARVIARSVNTRKSNAPPSNLKIVPPVPLPPGDDNH